MLFLLFLVLHSTTTLNAEICGSKSIVCLNSTSYKSCINPGGSAITTGDVEICDPGTVCDSSEGVYPCITETTIASTTPSITTISTSSSDTLCGSKSIICLNSTSYQSCINPGETAVVTGKVQNCDAGTVCDSSEGVYPCVTQITTTSTTASITTTSTTSTITAGTTSTATTSTTSSSSSLCGSKSIVCLNSTSYQSCINPGETAVVTGKAQICDVGTVCDSSEGVYPCVAETTTSTTSSITVSTTSSSDTICGSKSIVCLNSTSYQTCINPGETAVVTGKAQTCDVGTVCDSSEGVYPCVTQTTTTSTTASITTTSTISTITAGTTSTATTSTTSSSSSSETLCGSKSIVCLNSTSYQSCINPGETAVVTGKPQICDVGTVCDSSEGVYPCVAKTTTSTTSSITISTTSSSDTICGSKSIVCLNSTSYQTCINPGETAVLTGKPQICDVGTVCDSSEGVYPCIQSTESSQAISTSSTTTLFTTTSEPSTTSSTEGTSISSTISSSPTASITSTTTINTPTTSPTTTTTLEPSTSSTSSTLEPTTTTTTIRPTTISTTTTTTLRPTTTTTTTTSTTTAAPFECTAVGNFPASNCNEYYECVYILYYYKTTLLTCASGQSFDSTCTG